MNEITFKLSKHDLTLFKKVLKFKVVPQNFLIKRDDEKNIIIVFLDYYSQSKAVIYGYPEVSTSGAGTENWLRK